LVLTILFKSIVNNTAHDLPIVSPTRYQLCHRDPLITCDKLSTSVPLTHEPVSVQGSGNSQENPVPLLPSTSTSAGTDILTPKETGKVPVLTAAESELTEKQALTARKALETAMLSQ